MRAFFCVFVVVAVASCEPDVPDNEEDVTPAPGRIVGTLCGADLRPLPGVTVVARNGDGADAAGDVTDLDGRFVITVDVGSYDVVSIEDGGNVVIEEGVVVEEDADVAAIDVRCRG